MFMEIGDDFSYRQLIKCSGKQFSSIELRTICGRVLHERKNLRYETPCTPMSSDVQRFFQVKYKNLEATMNDHTNLLKFFFVSHDGTCPRLNSIQILEFVLWKLTFWFFSKQKSYFLKSLKEQSCSSKSMMIFSYKGDCCFGLRKVKTY